MVIIIVFTQCNTILIQSVMRIFGTDLLADLASCSRGKLHYERMHAVTYSLYGFEECVYDFSKAARILTR